MISTHQNQQTLRTLIQTKRCALTHQQVQTLSKQAATYLIQSNLMQNAKNVACYLSIQNEIDTTPILEYLFKNAKVCYLPVMDPLQFGKMDFIRYFDNDPLKTNRFHIQEPLFTPSKLIAPEALDLVIVPLVAFDKQGRRIGTGGGFYDRAFAFLKDKTMNNKKPFLIGYAYSFQETPHIHPNHWDIGLHAIATEKGFYWTKANF